MKLDLPIIRLLLRETFGHESFIASFITRIQEDERTPTACINAEGHLKYNPGFVNQYIQSREDLFCLIVHESTSLPCSAISCTGKGSSRISPPT